jgi:NADH-quinone oxidoreductase subunit J
MIQKAVFVLLSLLTLVPALLAVTVRNVFHAALWLVLSLTGVAGFFALLGADFLFVAQLLVYSGGIMVLLLFVVLLSGSPKDWAQKAFNAEGANGFLVAAVFTATLAFLLRLVPEGTVLAPAQPTTAPLGLLLLREMVLPFEVLSLVLLAALVGAVHFSKKDDQ